MDFKLAVTGTLEEGLPPDVIDGVKDAMADVVHQALLGLHFVEPQTFYLQLGEGTKVNVCTVPASDRCPRCDSHAPNLHPALQHEGEVQPCPHPFHGASTEGTNGS